MNIGNFRIFLVCILFLTSKVGLAFNVHFCAGSISEISFVWESAGCDMAIHEKQKNTHPHSHELKSESCCSDRIIVFENVESEQVVSEQGNKFLEKVIFLYQKDNLYNEIFLSKFNSNIIEDPPKLKLFLLYHSFIFYG